MIYLLDTDMFTLAQHGKHGLRERIESERSSNEIAVSLITRIEVLRGRFEAVLKAADGVALSRAQEVLKLSEAYLADFRTLFFDEAATSEFDRLRNHKKARKAGRNDLLVACICLSQNATLVTRNIKDYANVPGLHIENWSQ